jgi:hypothetical protein
LKIPAAAACCWIAANQVSSPLNTVEGTSLLAPVGRISKDCPLGMVIAEPGGHSNLEVTNIKWHRNQGLTGTVKDKAWAKSMFA